MSTENRFGSLGDAGGGDGGSLCGSLGGEDSKTLTFVSCRGGRGGGRSSGEQSFYARRPERTVAIGEVTERGLETAKLNSDGSITLGQEAWHSGPAKTMSQAEFLQHRANFKALDTSYRAAYQRWWDEGWVRGYVAGSPHERI